MGFFTGQLASNKEKTDAARTLYQLGWEFTKRHSRYILLIISSHRTNQRLMGRKTDSTAWRWEWHACTWVRKTAQTHCHNSLPRFTASFQLPKSSRTTRHSSNYRTGLKDRYLVIYTRSGWVTQVWVLLIWKPHSSVGGEGLKRKKDWGVLTLWIVFHLTSFNVAGIPQVKYYLLYLLKRMNLQYFAGWVRYIYSHPTTQSNEELRKIQDFFLNL